MLRTAGQTPSSHDEDEDHREHARPSTMPLPPADPAAPASFTSELCPAGPIFQYRFPYGCEYAGVGLEVPGLAAGLEGLRVVHLTDLHLKRAWSAAYERVVGRIREERPDLILITGDLVDDKRDCRPA